ncbi:MAG: transposase [Cyanobium sp.]
MACGVLGQDSDGKPHWHKPSRKPDFLFPVQALSKVFRGKFLAALTQAHRRQKLAHDPQGQPERGPNAWRGCSNTDPRQMLIQCQ